MTAFQTKESLSCDSARAPEEFSEDEIDRLCLCAEREGFDDGEGEPLPADAADPADPDLPPTVERGEAGAAAKLDLVRIYLTQIGSIPLLTPEEERDCALRAAEGSEAAKKLLTESNLRLVVSIAKRFHNSHLSFLDLIQEGNLGLMKAVDKYDHRKGYRFSTYATWWIRQSVSRAISEHTRLIRLPVHTVESINKLRKAKLELRPALDREPTAAELALKTGIPAQKIRELLRLGQTPISLERPLDEEGETSLGSFISDDASKDPEASAAIALLRETVGRALDDLEPRQKEVLELRFGFRDGKLYTLGEVGAMLGVTRERVRQIEEKALRRLKCRRDLRELGDDSEP